MAKSSNRPLSEWFGIDDSDIAFAFEIECSETLAEFEAEQEAAKAEMVGMGQAVRAFTGSDSQALVPKGFDTSKAKFHGA